jgi:non-heme chloroperoxidase
MAASWRDATSPSTRHGAQSDREFPGAWNEPGTLVSDQAYQASWNLATTASATAAVACISTWQTDFRADLACIDVPVLVIQGDDDQVLPVSKTGERLPGMVKDLEIVVIEGGPHAILWTHADQVNNSLVKVLA